MTRQSAAACLAALSCAALSCAACGDQTASSSGGGGAGAAATSTTTIGAGGAPCTYLKPPGVPDSWVRTPGAPCESDVYMAPEPEQASSAPAWTGCGVGCQEMVIDWSDDDRFRILGQVGAAGDGHRYLGFTRYLSAKGPYEVQLVRVTDNLVILDAIYQSKGGPWLIRPRAASPDGHIVELTGSTADPAQHQSVTYLVPAGGGPPELMLNEVVPWGMLEVTVSSELWAVAYQGGLAWGWHERSFSNEMNPGWSSPDGRLMLGIQAVGGNVFFNTLGPRHIEVWTAADGARALVDFPSSNEGACCFTTDGKDMVWLQGTGAQGDHTYAQVQVMRSPFATTAAALEPTVMRPAFTNGLFGVGEVGGGYAAHLESKIGAPGEDGRIIITRLSDGHYWVLAPPRGLTWHIPLYVDDEEVAIVVNNPDGYHATNWNIQRRSIAALGDPLPPGSGF